MSKVACKIRRENALTTDRSGYAVYKAGYSDTGCQTCEQGRKVAKEISAKQVEDRKAETRSFVTRTINGYCEKIGTEGSSPIPDAPKRRGRPPKLKPHVVTSQKIQPKKQTEPRTMQVHKIDTPPNKDSSKTPKKRVRINERRIEFGSKYASIVEKLDQYASHDFRSFRDQCLFIFSEYIARREKGGE